MEVITTTDLYLHGTHGYTRVTRSFAAFGGSCPPELCHGRRKRSGRSGFGRTTFSLEQEENVPSWLPSVLYGMAEKVIEVQYFSHAFTSPRDSKLDIQGLETRSTHGMETGLTRAALLTSRVKMASRVEMALMYYTELKNRKVRSGSVVQNIKVLREPIQVAEKAKVKKIFRAKRGFDHNYAALCTAFGIGRTTLK